MQAKGIYYIFYLVLDCTESFDKPFSVWSLNVQQVCVHISTNHKLPSKDTVQKEIALFVATEAKEMVEFKGLGVLSFSYILMVQFGHKKQEKKATF